MLPAGGEGGRLVCYQQAGRVGQAETEQKYVGVSGKRICYFTPPLGGARVCALNLCSMTSEAGLPNE